MKFPKLSFDFQSMSSGPSLRPQASEPCFLKAQYHVSSVETPKARVMLEPGTREHIDTLMPVLDMKRATTVDRDVIPL
ncbi:MAG: hypothetical protein IPK13_09870 [Deltaproteobacteria bacterium]|nr:hypothetical protein [Deltaproteobacteria bacterium]